MLGRVIRGRIKKARQWQMKMLQWGRQNQENWKQNLWSSKNEVGEGDEREDEDGKTLADEDDTVGETESGDPETKGRVIKG